MRRSVARRPSPSASWAISRPPPALYAALDESDRFAAWSVRGAIRRLEAWDKEALVAAMLDDRRAESALELTDEAWSVPVVEALTEVLGRSGSPAVRGRIVANLAGLYRRYPEWSGSWFGTNPLAGRFPEKTRDWSPEGMAGVLRGLAVGLADRDSLVRSQAIAGLARAGPAAAPHAPRRAGEGARPAQPGGAGRGAGQARR